MPPMPCQRVSSSLFFFKNGAQCCLLLMVLTSFLLHEVRSTSEVTEDTEDMTSDRARRSASFTTPLGKRITSTLVAELGKRPKDLYSFGIGKRSISEDEMAEYMAEINGENAASKPIQEEASVADGGAAAGMMEKREAYGFGLGKRAYSFGLGRKRAPDLSYSFGMGKRSGSPMDYGLALGKRAGEAAAANEGYNGYEDYNTNNRVVMWPFKKRNPYSFGLGKRQPYSMGLGR